MREHFRDDIGEFAKDIRLEIMHYLINLGCFDDGALEYLNTLYPSHDLILLGKEDFTPPENTVKIEVDNKAEKAKKEETTLGYRSMEDQLLSSTSVSRARK